MPDTYATVRKVLDLSSTHLPPMMFHDLNGYDGVTATRFPDGGWLLLVPDDPADHASDYGDPAEKDGVPPEVLTIQEYARTLGCDYIMIDGEAPANADLPSFANDWS